MPVTSTRRGVVTATVAALASAAGCLTDGDTTPAAQTPTDSKTPTPATTENPALQDDFEGWINEEELEKGYTVVYITSDWELVDPGDTENWNSETVQIFHRGFCKRYFVYERIPDGYEIFNRGSCEEGVTVSIQDGDGRIVAQIILPEKQVE